MRCCKVFKTVLGILAILTVVAGVLTAVSVYLKRNSAQPDYLTLYESEPEEE